MTVDHMQQQAGEVAWQLLKEMADARANNNDSLWVQLKEQLGESLALALS